MTSLKPVIITSPSNVQVAADGAFITDSATTVRIAASDNPDTALIAVTVTWPEINVAIVATEQTDTVAISGTVGWPEIIVNIAATDPVDTAAVFLTESNQVNIAATDATDTILVDADVRSVSYTVIDLPYVRLPYLVTVIDYTTTVDIPTDKDQYLLVKDSGPIPIRVAA